jgi:hypothetical protein
MLLHEADDRTDTDIEQTLKFLSREIEPLVARVATREEFPGVNPV